MPRYYLHSNVIFEPNALEKLPEELARLGITKPLMVTDPGLAELGMVQKCSDLVPELVAFDSTPPNPTELAANQAAELYRRHACDGIFALGGGSSMDLAKAVGILVTHKCDLSDYDVTGPSPKSLGPIAPLLEIPTTAGTGTEVSVGCVLMFNDGHKGVIDSERLIPATVICDPKLTLSLPARLTAATGMDALSHCIEGYCSNISNPLTEPIALDGIRRIAAAIERAVNEPNNLDARSDMMMGALQGGIAMSMELGAAHAMSVPIGAILHGHHGAETAAVLGAAMRFNEGSVPEKMKDIRDALGVPSDGCVENWVDNLCHRIGLGTSLRALGLDETDIDRIAEEAAHSVFNATNPRQGTVDEYRAILTSKL